MRSLAAFLCALVLVTGCASGTTISPAASTAVSVAPAASTAPGLSPANSPAATPAPSPSTSVTAVSARVTFDGAKCVYTGPTVIPFPASLTVEYAPTPKEEGSIVGIMAVASGTTEADISDPALPDIGVGTPSFVYLDTHMFSQGSGRAEYRAVPSGANPMADMLLDGKPYDTFVVMCIPEIPGRPAGGFTFLHVIS